MQVNKVQSNNTTFGAKLVINDRQEILRGITRVSRHRGNKFRSFSNRELKQIITGFEERTKNATGEMELKTEYKASAAYSHRSFEEQSKLIYTQNNGDKKQIDIQLFDNFPKTVDEFVDRLVGAFTKLKNDIKN